MYGVNDQPIFETEKIFSIMACLERIYDYLTCTLVDLFYFIFHSKILTPGHNFNKWKMSTKTIENLVI